MIINTISAFCCGPPFPEHPASKPQSITVSRPIGNFFPYVIDADRELIDRIAQNDMVRGVTIAAGGFFGPQGRELRIPLADPKQNEKIEKFVPFVPRMSTVKEVVSAVSAEPAAE